jgi:hypothetical protein
MTAYRTMPHLRREHFSCQRCQIILLYWRYFGNPLSALVCPGSQWIAVMNCEGWEGNAQCVVPRNYIGIVWRNWGKTQRSWKYSRCRGPKFDRRTFVQFDSAAQSPQFIFAEPINLNLQSNWHLSNICNQTRVIVWSGLDWIDLAENRIRWGALVDMNAVPQIVKI